MRFANMSMELTMENTAKSKAESDPHDVSRDIRDDAGRWRRIDHYIQEHSDARFSHGICPKCAERDYPEQFDSMDFDGETSA